MYKGIKAPKKREKVTGTTLRSKKFDAKVLNNSISLLVLLVVVDLVVPARNFRGLVMYHIDGVQQDVMSYYQRGKKREHLQQSLITITEWEILCSDVLVRVLWSLF